MPKVIDTKECAERKQSKMNSLEQFILSEFKKESPELSVRTENCSSLLSATVVRKSIWNEKDILELTFDEDDENTWLESIDVHDRTYQHLAETVAGRYESEFKAKEVKIYLY
ncbi:MAG: hypothetical protein V1886_02295 [archaeon]